MSLSRAITGVISTNSRRSTKWPLSLGSSFTAQQLASFSSSPWKQTSETSTGPNPEAYSPGWSSSPATEAPAPPSLENYNKSSDLPCPKEISFQSQIANYPGLSSSPVTEVPASPSLENYKNSVDLQPPKEIPFQPQIANSPGSSSSPATKVPAPHSLENYKKLSDLPTPKEIPFQPQIANYPGLSSSPATEVPASPSFENYKSSVELPPPKEIPFQPRIANSPGFSSSPAPPSLENYMKLSDLLLPKEIPFQPQIANYPGLSSLPATKVPAPPSLENYKNSVDLPPRKEIPFQPQIANSSGLPSSPATEVPAPPSLDYYKKLSDLPPPKEIPFQPQIASSPGLSSSPATKAPAPPSSENYKKSSDLQRLKEAPFQPQIANQVHLVGYIGAPVQIQMLPNGSCVAVSVLTSKKIKGLLSFRIPVIFQGDLAQIAACRLKENDLIYVTGQLSGDAPSVAQEVSCTNIQVLADKLSFVHDGSSQSTPSFKAKALKLDSRKSWDDLVLNPSDWFDYRKDKLNGLINPNYPDFKNRMTLESLWLDKAPSWVSERLEQLVFASSTEKNAKEPELDSQKSWDDLVLNPSDWFDYRNDKLNGLINPNHPDFKNQKTRESLWLDRAPSWVSERLEQLVFASSTKKNVTENSWKNLIDNPNDWWDCRTTKPNEKCPDFLHKETGEALWLSSWGTPDWASSKFAPAETAS